MALEVVRDVEVVLDRVLALAGHDDDRGEARRHGLLDHVLDDRLVDERQHLLGLRLRGRQEAGAEPGGRKHGLADPADRRHSAKSYHARPESPATTVITCTVMLDLKFVVENRDTVLGALAARGQGLATIQAFPGLAGVDPWALDGERRALILETEALRHQQRSVGEEIARRGKAKQDASELKAEMKGVADRIKQGEARLEEVKGGDRALPAGGAEPARRERAGRQGRDRQPGGPSRRRAAGVRLRAARARRARRRARDPRLRARGAALRGALRGVLGARGLGWSGRSSSSCSSLRPRAATRR